MRPGFPARAGAEGTICRPPAGGSPHGWAAGPHSWPTLRARGSHKRTVGVPAGLLAPSGRGTPCGWSNRRREKLVSRQSPRGLAPGSLGVVPTWRLMNLSCCILQIQMEAKWIEFSGCVGPLTPKHLRGNGAGRECLAQPFHLPGDPTLLDLFFVFFMLFEAKWVENIAATSSDGCFKHCG